MDQLIKHVSVEAAARKAAAKGSDVWLSDSKRRGAGRLCLRVMPKGAVWYFRYSRPDGSRDTWTIGPYRTDGRTRADADRETAGLTIAQARRKAEELATIMRQTGDVRGHFAELERQREEARRAEEAARQAAVEAERRRQTYTLAALLNSYCDHLERRGKLASARHARSVFRRHVVQSFPELAERPAADLASRDVAAVLRRISDSGATRTAGVVRSYMAAAYALAVRAEHDPQAPADMISFGITQNPVTAIPARPVAHRDRALKLPELVALVRRLEEDPRLQSKAVLLCVLAGGQRPQQMLRLRVRDCDDGTILLFDPKGRRSTPRPHLVPLGERGRELLARLIERAAGKGHDVLFAAGKQPLDVRSVSRYVRDLGRQMLEAGELAEPFQLRDVRRTIETLLAGIGVSRDTRAQLLSHGVGGIQARYDRHTYLPEKRAAVEALEDMLFGDRGSRVVPILRRSSRD